MRPERAGTPGSVAGGGSASGREGGRQPAGLRSLVVIGAGLIGASIGLAARRHGVDVSLRDVDPSAVDEAVAVGAGRPWQPGTVADHAVVCVPPSAVGGVVLAAQRLTLARTFSDTAGTKSYPCFDAESLGVDMTRFVGGHPMAGRERGGALNARADLFRGRPWVLVPGPRTTPAALRAATTLVGLMDADLVTRGAEEHDRAVASVSHLPQLLASALAARAGLLDDRALALAGAGFADMTRLARSDPTLWADVCVTNAAALAEALGWLTDRADEVRRVLLAVAAAEDPEARAAASVSAAAVVRSLVGSGNTVVTRLPRTRATRSVTSGNVAVVVPDAPGALLQALSALATAAVNVEDIRVDHAPGQPLGVVELTVLSGDVARAVTSLQAGGLPAYPVDDRESRPG